MSTRGDYARSDLHPFATRDMMRDALLSVTARGGDSDKVLQDYANRILDGHDDEREARSDDLRGLATWEGTQLIRAAAALSAAEEAYAAALSAYRRAADEATGRAR